MNPRCHAILERLVEATTGSVPPAERAGIAEHLAQCPACRAEAAEIEATALLVQRSGEVAAPPGFWTDFNARLGARLSEEQRTVGDRLHRWLWGPRQAWGALALTAATAVAIAAAVRVPPMLTAPDATAARARSLMTESMATTVPSLDDLLKTWRAGLNPETVVPD
jgi:anti-sigma factor RsiW